MNNAELVDRLGKRLETDLDQVFSLNNIDGKENLIKHVIKLYLI